MRTSLCFALALVASLPTALVQAEPLVEPSSEVRFEKAPSIDGKPYLCLGAGIRKKAFFRVYAVAYCVEDAEGKVQVAKYFEGAGKKHATLKGEALAEALADDPEFFKAMMALPVGKAAEMVFVRDVSKEKMKDAFVDSLTRTLGAPEKGRIDGFVGLLDKDLKEKDRLVLRTRPTGEIAVGLSGELKSLKDDLLARAVWEPYLGPDSVAPSLKKAVAVGVAALRK